MRSLLERPLRAGSTHEDPRLPPALVGDVRLDGWGRFYYVAAAWQVYSLSDSPSSLAFVGIAWSLPQVLIVPVTGVLADRMDRRVRMIAADVIRAIAIGAVGILSITGALTIPLLVGLVVIFGVGQALFQPAFQSIVPDLVPEEMLVRANSVDQFVRRSPGWPSAP